MTLMGDYVRLLIPLATPYSETRVSQTKIITSLMIKSRLTPVQLPIPGNGSIQKLRDSRPTT